MPCNDDSTQPATHPLNDTVTLTATFRRKSDDALVDPTNVILVVTDPDGTETTYQYTSAQITRESIGLFTKDILLNLVGMWSYKFNSTGAVVTSHELTEFEVVA